MSPAGSFRSAFFALILCATAGCTRNLGEAVVLEKEHIDAAEPSPTPAPTPVATSTENAVRPEPAASPEASASKEPVQTELAPDEIVVDTYVMKKDVRGTKKDPRASTQEQWLMKVEAIQDGKRFTIHADRAHFLKYKVGDRVRVRYKVGNYTGTVWDATIED
ncbi:MAG TPA: hypothetical protein VJS88_00320 [Chthoniobacterales bacterium]|nr:hypothetical protein [Chthoniobacterales bacterium]